MREIILDTETTGLSPRDGHRVVEIGCIELVNYVPTGRHWHQYLNPERDMPPDAAAIHGLTEEFLADKPIFAAVVDAFHEFAGDSPLVIHNAAFDLGFMNAELERIGFSSIPAARAIDTVALARRKFPGQRASLDALCERFGVDKSARNFHGALLDAQLLAEVYLELRGGRQPGLTMDIAGGAAMDAVPAAPRQARPPRAHAPLPEELAAHEAALEKVKNPLWRKRA